jgi:hypothetical protein
MTELALMRHHCANFSNENGLITFYYRFSYAFQRRRCSSKVYLLIISCTLKQTLSAHSILHLGKNNKYIILWADRISFAEAAITGMTGLTLRMKPR